MSVDRTAAAAFLSERYGAGVTNVEALHGGEWSAAFGFRHGGRDLVARFGLHVGDYLADQKAMAFASPDLPVPEVLEIGEALGGYYAISQRHFGVVLEELNADGLRSVMPSLLHTLDAMRELTPPNDAVDWANGDLGGPSWTEWLAVSVQDLPGRRTVGWRSAIESEPAVATVFDSAEKEMRSLFSACPEGHHLVHRDLINRNVLVSADASRLEAVFDWGCSVVGDFVYEIAWFTLWGRAPWHPVFEEVDFRRALLDHYAEIGLTVPNFEERLRCYQLHIALDSIAYQTFMNRVGQRDNVLRVTQRILDWDD